MKDETGGFAIEKLFGLKQKMQVFGFGREHEKENDVNKNFTATINKQKKILLNKKYLRHYVNRLQSKQHRLETYKSDKISLSYFDDKICAVNNRYDHSHKK